MKRTTLLTRAVERSRAVVVARSVSLGAEPLRPNDRVRNGSLAPPCKTVARLAFAFALFVQVDAAISQSATAQARAALVDATAGLPKSVQLSALSPDDVGRLAAAYEPNGCGGWVFAASESNPDQPGPPLIALPPAKYGVFRVRAGLGPVAGITSRRADAVTPSQLVKHSGFSLGPWVEVTGWQDAQAFMRDTANWEAGPALSVRATDGRIAERRVPCTLGGGMCRRYVGTYRGRWVSKENIANALPIEVLPARLIVEDRCPWTRSALIELYASRIGLFEWYYERTNP